MSCDITEERLWSWIDRSAPELDEHLAGCSRCRDLAEEVRRDMQHVSIATAPPHDRLPERIGSYTVSRLIGEGGQGLVYEAEQQTPRRRVALKVLKNGDGGRNRDVRLFEREVESLARLEHSGIASIYEAGRTEDGRNYFAMELIDGAPLNTYVRERGLTLRDRLGLFTRICDSVTYAHQRGVIHRDLKPSNILVDQGGAPHILDFGLARTTDSDVTLTLTEDDVGKIQGTLPYMCPEQAAGHGADVDVRGDAYSLGVLLYELLTDQLPHKVSCNVPYEALRAIREDPPTRPSSIKPALRGDLETILLKALEKEPERRYQSVAALADDVQRFLDGEAILARPASASYQLRKLMARHKLPFAFAAALFVVVAAFGVVAALQAARVGRERDKAIAAAHRAERTQNFLQDLFVAADPRWTPGEMTILDLLEEAERRVESDWSDEPELEADLRTILGRTYHRFGISAKARPLLEAALRVRERIHDDRHPAVAEARFNLGFLLISTGHYDAADELFTSAARIQRQLFGERHPDTLKSIRSLVNIKRLMGELDEAEKLGRELVAGWRARAGNDSREAAAAIDSLAGVLMERKQHVAAETLYREALAIRQRLFGERHKEIAHTLKRLAWTYKARGAYEEAEAHYRRALAIFAALPGEAPNELAVMLDLAETAQDRGDLPEALTLFASALERADAEYPEWHYIRLWSHRKYGECLARLERYEEAEPHLKAALEGYRRLGGDDHHMTRLARESITKLYENWGKPELAAVLRIESPAQGPPRGEPGP